MKPKVAVLPTRAPDWISQAVVDGGGELVPLAEAEALVWAHPRDVEGLQSALRETSGLRWIQMPWAGVERFAAAGVFDDEHIWTCGKGVYAEEVAEHALALALAGLRLLPQRARARTWEKHGGRSLLRGRVTILGGGGITDSLVRLLAPFETEITVVRRSPQTVAGAARTLTADHLAEALPGADVVFLALALTPETEGIIGRDQLEAMDDAAWLVNVARGGHIDTDALVEALQAGTIGGAALDVTDPEPLPDGHPLWDLSNCLITPHTANTPDMARPVLSGRIRENVARFAQGEPLMGLVDPAAGY